MKRNGNAGRGAKGTEGVGPGEGVSLSPVGRGLGKKFLGRRHSPLAVPPPQKIF